MNKSIEMLTLVELTLVVRKGSRWSRQLVSSAKHAQSGSSAEEYTICLRPLLDFSFNRFSQITRLCKGMLLFICACYLLLSVLDKWP